MNLPIVNRDAELARLHALADSGRHWLALLTGRRRVGKTYLLANGWDDRPVFFSTASKTTPELNRRQLVEAVAEWASNADASTPWRSPHSPSRCAVSTNASVDPRPHVPPRPRSLCTSAQL